MRNFHLFLLSILTISCTITEKIPPGQAQLEEWKTNQESNARWDYMQGGKRINSLSAPLYSKYTLDYNPLKRNLERITGQQFGENAMLVIGYNYKDDLCHSQSVNTWDKIKIRDRKSFLKSIRETVLAASEEVVYLYLFEEGIVLENNPHSKKEYFFQDKNNLFRRAIFRDPATCGSYALVKPNGQVLVRNGEYRADWMASLLSPEYWEVIFDQ